MFSIPMTTSTVPSSVLAGAGAAVCRAAGGNAAWSGLDVAARLRSALPMTATGHTYVQRHAVSEVLAGFGSVVGVEFAGKRSAKDSVPAIPPLGVHFGPPV
ncbi:MAG: hypothetical protein U0Q15_10580 [Kineosporiaceae bacterium]